MYQQYRPASITPQGLVYLECSVISVLENHIRQDEIATNGMRLTDRGHATYEIKTCSPNFKVGEMVNVLSMTQQGDQ